MAPWSQTFFGNRVSLHYWDYGSPGNRPLVLVHGGMDHARSWDAIAPALVDDFHVLAPDLSGHGDSPWVDPTAYGIFHHLRALNDFCAAVASGPVDLIGHSMGGMVSLFLAAVVPERVKRVVAIEGLGAPSWLQAAEPDAWVDFLREWVIAVSQMGHHASRPYPTLDAMVARMRAANPHLSRDLARALTLHGTRRTTGGLTWKFDPAVRASALVRMDRTQMQQILGRIQCPVLLVNGIESWAGSYAEAGLEQCVKHGRVVNIPAAGHWVHHDQPDDFCGAVRRFFAESAL